MRPLTTRGAPFPALRRVLFHALCVLAPACTRPVGPPAPTDARTPPATDAAVDARVDAPPLDAPADAPADAPPLDAPPLDAPADVRPDAPADVRSDAPADVRPDAPADVVSDAGPSSTRHTPRPLGSVPGAMNGYWEYLPPGYGGGARRPLLVFWHGIGENGNGTTDLGRVRANGPPRLINENRWPSDRPFVVLSPQHSGGGCPTADEIQRFIAFATGYYAVDPTRVYLTGLSCGAIGSWNYLGQHRGTQVAAAALVCGDGRGAYGRAMCALGEVAIWGFHGDADPTVPVDGTRVPINNLLANCPAPPRRETRLTIYPGVGHDSWTRTYDLSAGHDIYTWLLRFTRP